MSSKSSQPTGNNSSLVPEVRSMQGTNPAPNIPSCKHGSPAPVAVSRTNGNNSFQNLSQTGKS